MAYTDYGVSDPSTWDFSGFSADDLNNFDWGSVLDGMDFSNIGGDTDLSGSFTPTTDGNQTGLPSDWFTSSGDSGSSSGGFDWSKLMSGVTDAGSKALGSLFGSGSGSGSLTGALGSLIPTLASGGTDWGKTAMGGALIASILADKDKVDTTKVDNTVTSSMPDWYKNMGETAFNSALWMPSTYNPTQLSGNEQQGAALAGSNVGSWKPGVADATGAIKSSMGTWADADKSKYTDPYLQSVLDTTLARSDRDFAQAEQRRRDAVKGSMVDYSRGRIEGDLASQLHDESKNALEAQLRSQAYTNGQTQFNTDQNRTMTGGQQLGSLAQLGTTLGNADVGALMSTGAVGTANNRQNTNDANQWYLNRSGAITGALNAIRPPTTQTTSTTSTAPRASTVSQLSGLIPLMYGMTK